MTDAPADTVADDSHEDAVPDSPVSAWRVLVALMFAFIFAYIAWVSAPDS